jgi:hypothetical protein
MAQEELFVCSCSLDNVSLFTVLLYFQDGGVRGGGGRAWKFWRGMLATKKHRQYFSGVSRMMADFL